MPSTTPPKPPHTHRSDRLRRIATTCGTPANNGGTAADGPFSGGSGQDTLNTSLHTLKTATSMTYDIAGTTGEGEPKGHLAVDS